MEVRELVSTAQALVAGGKGVLAVDESSGTCSARFQKLGIPSSAETRRDYRELLLAAPGLGEFISGAILYDETFRQTTRDGAPLPALLARQGILPGVKVDTGTAPLAGSPDEKVTDGLDRLGDRVAEYRGLGARFAKWRAVLVVGPSVPTRTCVAVNAHALARYARICQEGGLVPIVEPEVLMDGDHDAARCEDVTTGVLSEVFRALFDQGVLLEGMLLKPNMVVAGKECRRQPDEEEVALRTVRCLRRTVPAAVPGVAFLSGGQGEEAATRHLNAMNIGYGPHAWKLSFSYGRALQDLAMRRWGGKAENVAAAQRALLWRARLNAAASLGNYTPEMEDELEAA
jgi:fructose-bisphosphate aldolase class I